MRIFLNNNFGLPVQPNLEEVLKNLFRRNKELKQIFLFTKETQIDNGENFLKVVFNKNNFSEVIYHKKEEKVCYYEIELKDSFFKVLIPEKNNKFSKQFLELLNGSITKEILYEKYYSCPICLDEFPSKKWSRISRENNEDLSKDWMLKIAGKEDILTCPGCSEKMSFEEFILGNESDEDEDEEDDN
jgi:hypothetical protein